jgi:hypothetical protein
MDHIRTDNPQTASEPALRARALAQVKRRRDFHAHLVAHVVAGLLLVIVWAVTEYDNAGGWPTALRSGRMHHDWDPWIIYPLIAGTVALGVHAWIVFGRRPATEADVAREIERLRGQA